MRTVARWLWHCIPTQLRYRLYHRVMNSQNAIIRRTVWFFTAVTLQHHRFTVSTIWPDVRGADHIALAVWANLVRFHSTALRLTWRYGHLVRRMRRPRPKDATPGVVLHVTGSFDLGGTQTQIKNLCTAESTRFQHRAVEIFPELNYLYRREVAVEPGRYIGRGILCRTVGRLAVSYNYRSSQLVQIYKLVCDFRAERPEVVVGWGHEMSVTTFIAGAWARVPHIVFCIRTVNPSFGWVEAPFPALLIEAHRRMLPRVSKVVVNSTLLRGDHAAWVGMPPAAIEVCANGIDVTPPTAEETATARAKVRGEHRIGDDVTVIAHVGRFSAEKGHASIVEANRLLLERGMPRPFMWLLCGDGPTMPHIREAVERHGMTNVVFLGRTDRVREVLCASDIFVMPSDYEGMPNAMMEAMAAGLPCVSANRTGALDVGRPDREALYYEPGNALELARHLDRLLADPAAARQLGAAAARRITEFSSERAATAFESILAPLVDAGGGSRRVWNLRTDRA